MEPASAGSAEGFNEWEMVADDLSVFPPNQHEGLPFNLQDNKPSISSVPSSPRHEANSDCRPVPDKKEIFWKFWKCGIRKLAAGVWNLAVRRSVFWTFGPVTAILAVVLVSLVAARAQSRWRRALQERSRLVLLIREKDQKIKQLLVEIEKINVLLIGRQKVPVLRIGIEKPRA